MTCPSVHFVDASRWTTRTGLKEIPQDLDDEWGRYPNPPTSDQDIGSDSRVGYALYFYWRKFRLSGIWAQARAITRFFSRQVVTLVSPFIHLPFWTLSNIFALLTSQLAVRNHF